MFSYAKNKQPPDNCPLSSKSQTIPVVSDFNILGVHFSSMLNSTSHINYVINELSSFVGALSKLRFVIPTRVKTLFYQSLFLSHLNNCQLVWGATTQTNKRKIFILQKRALGEIFNIHLYKSVEPAMNSFHETSIQTLYAIRLFMAYRKASCSDQQNSFLQLANLTQRNIIYPTRQPDICIVECSRTKYGSQKLCFVLPSLLNKLLKSNTDIMNSTTQEVIGFLTA